MNHLKFQVWLWNTGRNLWCLDKSTQMPPISLCFCFYKHNHDFFPQCQEKLDLPSCLVSLVALHTSKVHHICHFSHRRWPNDQPEKQQKTVSSRKRKDFHYCFSKPIAEWLQLISGRRLRLKTARIKKKSVLSYFSLIKKRLECLERLVKGPLHF